MIYHNTKNGFPSAIVNEIYKPGVIRIYSTPSGRARRRPVACKVFVTYDLFGSTLSLRLEDEIYWIPIDKIISDILEVEHENETLFSDH